MNKSLIKTICIPGFLGDGFDFNWLSIKHDCIEIFKDDSFLIDFQNFEKVINQKYQLTAPINAIGYSLGARLLLNALVSNPSLFRKVVIISAHTGLTSKLEKNNRIESDKEWAKKFDNDLHSTFQQWQQQSVFDNHLVERNLERLNSQAIRYALTAWSLGNMQNLLPKLSLSKVPILWIVGENDEKFVKIAKEVSSINKNIQLNIVPSCGHRVMWQAPNQINALVDDFLKH